LVSGSAAFEHIGDRALLDDVALSMTARGRPIVGNDTEING